MNFNSDQETQQPQTSDESPEMSGDGETAFLSSSGSG